MGVRRIGDNYLVGWFDCKVKPVCIAYDTNRFRILLSGYFTAWIAFHKTPQQKEQDYPHYKSFIVKIDETSGQLKDMNNKGINYTWQDVAYWSMLTCPTKMK